MYQRNIIILFIIKACKWFMIYMPVILLFYNENGLGTKDLFYLHAVYSATIAILEVPSGYIADSWGRKPALVIGTLFGFLGFGVFSFGQTFWIFLVAEILLGVGQSLLSGADTAMLYDTMLQHKKHNKYIQTEGKITAVGNFAEAAAGVFTIVFLFSSNRYYFVIQCGLAFFAFAASTFLIEPQVHAIKLTGKMKAIVNIARHTFTVDKVLRNYILLSSVIGFASLTMAWFAQPIFQHIGLEGRTYRLAWVVLNLFVALGSMSSYLLRKKIGLFNSLLLMSIVLSAGYFITGSTLGYASLSMLALFYYIRGTAHPILKARINDLTSSDKRATIFSLRSLLIRIAFAVFGPILGYLSDNVSLAVALKLCGMAVLISGGIFLFQVKKLDTKLLS